MELALTVLVGVGLAAACGFRVFVPLLGISLAAQTGHLELASGFGWIGSPVAAAAFGVATLLEVGAYLVPWVDNALDALASPAAVVAGTIAMAYPRRLQHHDCGIREPDRLPRRARGVPRDHPARRAGAHSLRVGPGCPRRLRDALDPGGSRGRRISLALKRSHAAAAAITPRYRLPRTARRSVGRPRSLRMRIGPGTRADSPRRSGHPC